MSQFFEKNKRKSLVGLLFFFRGKKRVAPLVLVAVALASGVVLWPSVQSHVNWPPRIARVLNAVQTRSLDFPGLTREMFSSKARQDATSRIVLPGSTAASYPGQSSMGLVKGAAEALKAPGPTADRLGGKTVRALARPVNARGVPSAVPLSEEEMKSGLAQADFARIITAGEAAAPAAADAGNGPGAAALDGSAAGQPESRILLAGTGGYGGARAVDAGPGGLVQRMMDTRRRSLAGGGSLAGTGGQLGRLSAFSQQKGVQVVNLWNSGQGPRCDQAVDALCDLVVTRTVSKAGRDSIEQCIGCAMEPGAHLAATSYDGKSMRQSGVVTKSDEPTPIDDGDYVDSLMTSGEQLRDKINGCDELYSGRSMGNDSRNLSAAAYMAQQGPIIKLLQAMTAPAQQACEEVKNNYYLWVTACPVAGYAQEILTQKYSEYTKWCEAQNIAAKADAGQCQFRTAQSFECSSPQEWNDLLNPTMNEWTLPARPAPPAPPPASGGSSSTTE